MRHLTHEFSNDAIDGNDTHRIKIIPTLTNALHVAHSQASLSILDDLALKNSDIRDFQNSQLVLTCDPPLAGPKTWQIPNLEAGAILQIEDLIVPIDGEALRHLDQIVPIRIQICFHHGGRTLAIFQGDLVALPKNRWPGHGSKPEMLMPFVVPDAPAIATLLRQACEVLRLEGENPSIDGYQARSRRRVWQFTTAIWHALGQRTISPIAPDEEYLLSAQVVRTPDQVFADQTASELELALLLAAALERAELNPLILFFTSKILVAVWLQPRQLPSFATDEITDFRRALANLDLFAIDPILVCHPRKPFPTGTGIAESMIMEGNPETFLGAIDIRFARSQIPEIHRHRETRLEDFKDPPSQPTGPLPPPPELPAFDFGLITGPPPNTPETRLDHWKRKLLDLTKRNRLLNLKLSRTAVRLICPNPAALEDQLASGAKITVIPASAPDGENVSSRQRGLSRTIKDSAIQNQAADAFHRREILADLDATELGKSLVQLYRKANTDLQEGGANTLFIALGILIWRQSPYETRTFAAPLILLPVRLERRSAASAIRLVHHEDDPVFNMTLLEMLRQDFQLDIPGMDGDLPRDASGIDVVLIWDTVREAVGNRPGFEVQESLVLSTFSFAKYLMWKDLTSRTEILKRNPFVRHLIDNPRAPYPNSADFLPPDQIDATLAPADIFLPMSADSSQLVAIHASTLAGDFILEGPPGTGKSQTIANIIAHNLGVGRKVLFVSEKMAALEVVHRRLQAIGLGEFCLELHSNKANKKEVLAHLGNTLKNKAARKASNWKAEAGKLEVIRDRLNTYVQALHQPGPDGISAHTAIGRVAKCGQIHRLRLDWPIDLETERPGLAELQERVRQANLAFSQLDEPTMAALGSIGREKWSKSWENQLVRAAKQLQSKIEELQASTNALLRLLRRPEPLTHLIEFEGISQIAESLAVADAYPIITFLENDGANLVTFEEAGTHLRTFHDLRKTFPKGTEDHQTLDTMLALWEGLWKKSAASWWFPKFLGLRRLKKELQLFFGLETVPEPVEVLARLNRLKQSRNALENIGDAIPKGTPWKGQGTDQVQWQSFLYAGQVLTQGIEKIASNGSLKRATLIQSIQRLVGHYHDQPKLTKDLKRACRDVMQTIRDFKIAVDGFKENGEIVDLLPASLKELALLIEKMLASQSRLKSWCQWQAARHDVVEVGLGIVIDALVGKKLDPEGAEETFKTAYHAWLADCLIDSSDVLRQFSASTHEDDIHRFRELDRKLAELSSTYITNKLKFDIPEMTSSKLPPGFGVLARELRKRRRHIPIRKLIAQMGPALTRLTPCLLMSPLSVAQYLAADQRLFDLVVFDEASQITVWDAVGAISRGRNVIVVGDPKQMPPTSFFERSPTSDWENHFDYPEDLESILDEAMGAKLKWHRLTRHYRSRNESLIAFSNQRYYQDDLVTFPAPETQDTAVTLMKVDGIYDRGRTRTNPIEAEAVVKAVVQRLKDPKTNSQSIGIVTFNAEQQKLVEDLLDAERCQDPDLEPFFTGDSTEPVFVKNLETVQGDQRDVIFLSVGYGPDQKECEAMSMNFGPLNRKGGERRLNVAITRATTAMFLFASFDPSQIDLTRTSARAVRDLKHFMEFAKSRTNAYGGPGSKRAHNRNVPEFQAAIATELEDRGWTVHAKVGVSRFKIDLAVVHPDSPDRYLAGIELDGATYRSFPSAKDRDQIRQDIMEGLDWHLIRIWSMDYFIDAETTMNRVQEALEAWLIRSRDEMTTL